MSKVKIEVDFKEIKKVISNLSENEKEVLSFELNPVWGRALQKMEKEVLKNPREGKTIPLEKIEDELQDRIWGAGTYTVKEAGPSDMQKDDGEDTSTKGGSP